MDILLSNIQPSQLPFIEEMAKVLGITFKPHQAEEILTGLVNEDEIAFNAEQECRFNDLETGKVKGYSWKQVKVAARAGNTDPA